MLHVKVFSRLVYTISTCFWYVMISFSLLLSVTIGQSHHSVIIKSETLFHVFVASCSIKSISKSFL